MVTKVVVIGNCQRGAIADFLQTMSNSVQTIAVIPVDTLPENTQENYDEKLKEADFIFSQNISDDYPVKWIGRSNLVNSYGDKMVFFTNHFFDGYCPELCYIHDPDGRRHVLPGPMGDIHIETIIYSYQNGYSQEQAIALMNDPEFFFDHYRWASQKSLDELARREKMVDIKIRDYIEEHYRRRRLFYTFNHPITAVMIQSCKKMYDHIGLKYEYDISELFAQEYLAAIIKSVAEPIYKEQGMSFDNPNYHRGFAMKFENDQYIPYGGAKYYNSEELVGDFYKVYEHNHERIMKFPISFQKQRA